MAKKQQSYNAPPKSFKRAPADVLPLKNMGTFIVNAIRNDIAKRLRDARKH